jgi:tetratricopeptide (TPR) repeat protein
MKAFLALAAVATLMAIPAGAAVSVIGGGDAEICFQAAKGGKSDTASLDACSLALDAEQLTTADRGATLVNRGVIKLRREDYEAAHADFDAGIALVPNVGESWINRGAMFIGQRRYKEALADLDKAISLGLKEPAKAFFDRAIAYEGLDDEQSAYLDYQQALVLAPGWAQPQHELERFTITRR